MKLTSADMNNPRAWAEAGITLPAFDRAKASETAKQTPEWVHFGAGNIFRAFPAAMLQTLLERGLAKTGLIVAEGYDYEIVERMLRPFDNLTLLVTLKNGGGFDKKVIASIVESLTVKPENTADAARLKSIFASPSLRMASFTITEKGYALTRQDNSLMPDVAADMANGPHAATSYMGKVAALLHERFVAGARPVAMVSMDNCSHNGDRLHEAMCSFAKAWTANGKTEKGFAEYVNNPKTVSFPWSMIDKITPRPDDQVRDTLAKDGVENMGGIITAKNTFVAPFVNAEETEYLIIEDWFPNGRPLLEQAGAMFTDRETVDKVEKMKVCTCLNPLHTALAVFGCLLGYDRISEEMRDKNLVALVRRIGYAESLPVVVNPGIMDPEQFLDTVLNVRFPNPFIPDTPQRIATDTSQKLAIRFGETINAYLRDGLDTTTLKGVSLVLAGWCRYLLGIDDAGAAFAVSPDPLYAELSAHLRDIRLGEPVKDRSALRPILCDARIFGVDLYAAGLGDRVENLFAAMVAGGAGAVRRVLQEETDSFAFDKTDNLTD